MNNSNSIPESILCDNIGVNEKGNLTFAGFDTVELGKKYGTPLYLVDENKIREKLRTYKRAMSEFYDHGSFPSYASKALCAKFIYRILAEENVTADVVSIGELYTAISVGFPAERLFFHGNNKTNSDIHFAIDKGCGYFVVDNQEELDEIDKYSAEVGKKQKVLIRVSPGIDPHTFKAVATGNVDSKFGFAIETGQAEEITAYALKLKNIELCGFHCHIGSQIFDAVPFIDAAHIMLEYMIDIRKKYDYTADILNLGGGFGVPYVEADGNIDIVNTIKEIGDWLDKRCTEIDYPHPTIIHEPGRSIVADAGLTLYEVGTVKEITGLKNYVSIDGGMYDNPRFALYEAQYTATVANRVNEPKDYFCSLVGRCCESGDIIAEDIYLQKPQRNDTIAVFTTGAYNYTMASNYNRMPRPSIVLLTDKEDHLVVKRETLDDMLKNEI